MTVKISSKRKSKTDPHFHGNDGKDRFLRPQVGGEVDRLFGEFDGATFKIGVDAG